MALLLSLREQQQCLENRVTDLGSSMNKKMEDLSKTVQSTMENKVAQDEATIEEVQKRMEVKVLWILWTALWIR